MASNYGNNNGSGHKPGKENGALPGGNFKQKKRTERMLSAQDAEVRAELPNLIESYRPPGGYRSGGFVDRITNEAETDNDRGFSK